MQGLCVSIKESEVHLQLKECKDFSSKITLYFLEKLLLSSSIFKKIGPNYLHTPGTSKDFFQPSH